MQQCKQQHNQDPNRLSAPRGDSVPFVVYMYVIRALHNPDQICPTPHALRLKAKAATIYTFPRVM
jgi:hypothetical protein